MEKWKDQWLPSEPSEHVPPSVCRMFTSRPLAMNPSVATTILFLVDNNGVILDDGGSNQLVT